MNKLRLSLLAGAAALALTAAAPRSQAQVSFGVNIGGPAPVCPYGYYGYAPYNCAPYGYYGREWFNGGAFVGAGPWYRGRPGWYGPVNHDYDPRYGYHGGYPGHNDHFDRGHDFHDFHGNDWHGVHGEGHHEGFHGGHPQR
jgi:hypothetical protein